MDNNLVSIEDICSFHNIEINFIRSLEEFGLVRITVFKKNIFLHLDELQKLERFVRLSKDLSINLEGLHAVSQLLNQLYKMHDEMILLKNELHYYKQIH